MGRARFWTNLGRAIRIARFCEGHHISTGEGLERAAVWEADVAARRAGRREFLADMGRLAAVGAMGSVAYSLRLASAAPGPGRSVKVGIVGAGLAGLACADELGKNGINATLYDASTQIGGRCSSLAGFFPDQVAERGGEFIDNLHKTMLGYAKRFKLELEDVVKEPPGEVFYFFGDEHIPESAVVDEFRNLVDAMRDDLRTVGQPTADSHTEADARLDFTSLREYLATRGAGEIASKAIEQAYIAEYGLEIDQQSCLSFLLFIHADRRSKFRPFGVFSDERYHVIGGNEQIIAGLRDELPGQMQLGMKLVKARKNASSGIELTFKNGSKTISTTYDAVVFAIPFSTLREVELDASLSLPDWKRFAIRELRYGTNAKMMVGFDSRPWLAQGSNGSSYSDLAHHQTTWETNPTKATGEHAVLTDYSGGDRGAGLKPQQVEMEAESFLSDLDLVYPEALAAASGSARNRRVHLEHWPSNALVKGSYTCNHPGYFTEIADNEAKPVGNVYFAGEHANSFYEFQGFMEGAALSGIRAAHEILQDLKVGVLP
ncbi:MAG TPA: FAD-dependent oxidoreductase [Candidatus Tectomicrobia bacterium]|nr:FAD-dependent oxidoreductase [Candidatus Tectomicrobia bacterium]